MDILDKYMPLKDGENIIKALEGNAYNTSYDIFSRIFGFIIRIISILTGSTKKIYLVVTEKRVITVEVNKVLWFIDGSVSSRSYTPRSLSQTGYTLRRSLLIFKSHYLEFNSGSTSFVIKSKSGQAEVMSLITAITGLAERVTSK